MWDFILEYWKEFLFTFILGIMGFFGKQIKKLSDNLKKYKNGIDSISELKEDVEKALMLEKKNKDELCKLLKEVREEMKIIKKSESTSMKGKLISIYNEFYLAKKSIPYSIYENSLRIQECLRELNDGKPDLAIDQIIKKLNTLDIETRDTQTILFSDDEI